MDRGESPKGHGVIKVYVIIHQRPALSGMVANDGSKVL